ncbi:uncharacterized protein N7443_000875 [Penicillium atrosanguineum]|uniref:uncharacterized protein n=1 Tax=Penicillium atrosanguineum TaxID=1132637 RepID=UPI00238F1669|nr:uncharacterized protein N7443_000875 [Penicillium atrosanguineum]KAJ5313991.1 hypothetical protein N7443_000875 [Penicillium atrosanguineum]
MPERKDPLDLAETGDLTKFSKLEASLAQTEVAQRPNSRAQNDVSRHAENSDLFVNELDFNYDLNTRHYPLLDCGLDWSILNEDGMNNLLQPFSVKSPPPPIDTSPGRNMLVFLLPLVPAENTSYGSRILMTLDNANQIMETLDVNLLFLLNMIGRPDYGAPQTHWEADDDGRLLACALNTASAAQKPAVFLDDPFDIHVILSTLSFESSKFHVKRFQRFMWAQINKVDDHLGGLETSDRTKLGDLTKQLQIISQNADSHIGNADVAIITATAIQNAHSRLIPSLPRSSSFIYQRADDSISYIIASMEKQKIWFLNYKQRKDSTMSLVYNLVTQQDAANNIQIAHSMKQDSTSMNAIAALTMVFLPGTFAGTVVGAGVFGGAITGAKVWWVWVGITVPLTVLVMICWLLYQNAKKPMINASWVGKKGRSDSATDSVSGFMRRSSIFSSGFSFCGRGGKVDIGKDT